VDARPAGAAELNVIPLPTESPLDTSIELILKLETEVWEALRTGDSRRDGHMLSEDFLGVYPTGFANKAEHVGQLKNGPTVLSYELTSPRIVDLGENRFILAYKAIWIRLKNGVARPREVMFVSSVWEYRADRWFNTFSQDTPAV
jgi:hypothetical protein